MINNFDEIIKFKFDFITRRSLGHIDHVQLKATELEVKLDLTFILLISSTTLHEGGVGLKHGL